jgi:cyclic pyranopterin phosphate synthase
MGEFTHFDAKGNAIMVDVSEKDITLRTAVAKGKIYINSEVMEAVLNYKVKKGDVLGVARIAGIMAVKKTSELVPLSHPLSISKSSIDFEIQKEKGFIEAVCMVKTEGKTGVEMEALTGVTIALLTIYDMCKAIDKRMELSEIYLEKKSGGKSGDFFTERIYHD